MPCLATVFKIIGFNRKHVVQVDLPTDMCLVKSYHTALSFQSMMWLNIVYWLWMVESLYFSALQKQCWLIVHWFLSIKLRFSGVFGVRVPLALFVTFFVSYLCYLFLGYLITYFKILLYIIYIRDQEILFKSLLLKSLGISVLTYWKFFYYGSPEGIFGISDCVLKTIYLFLTNPSTHTYIKILFIKCSSDQWIL